MGDLVDVVVGSKVVEGLVKMTMKVVMAEEGEEGVVVAGEDLVDVGTLVTMKKEKMVMEVVVGVGLVGVAEEVAVETVMETELMVVMERKVNV